MKNTLTRLSVLTLLAGSSIDIYDGVDSGIVDNIEGEGLGLGTGDGDGGIIR
ncbi:MAG: hypothetical protein IJ618_05465 [Prevotella sp.]|nr:hypothetical protein [Prevotella sp.]